MKYLYTLFALIFTLHVTAQTDYTSTQKIVKEFSRYFAHADQWNRIDQRTVILEKTHKLDSVVSTYANGIAYAKTEAEYNNTPNTSTVRQYEQDSATSNLILQSIITFEYHAPDYPSRILFEALNTETQQFELQLEYDIMYDGSNRIDSMVISLNDPFGISGFGPYLATKLVYSGDLVIQSRQWINISLFGGWLPSSNTDFQYDNNDRIIEEITNSLDFGTFEFLPESRTTYAYNAQGLQETVTDYNWVDPSWEPAQRYNYDYYPNKTLSSEVREIYSNGIWVNNVWTSYPVEEVDDQYPVTSYIWDALEGKWLPSDSSISLLNPALPWDQVAAPSELGLLGLIGGDLSAADADFTGSSVDEIKYFLVDSLSQDFYFDSKDTYYYSLIEGAAVTTVWPSYLSVSPNPASEAFHIDFDLDTKATYRIYNATGVAVDAGDIRTGKNTIQTSTWPTGLYYVILRLEDGSVFVQKQMVE